MVVPASRPRRSRHASTAARAAARSRSGALNAALDDQGLADFAPLDASASALLRDELERGRLTARGYHRVRRVARTLADLAGAYEAPIASDFVVTALGMRTRVGFSKVEQAA